MAKKKKTKADLIADLVSFKSQYGELFKEQTANMKHAKFLTERVFALEAIERDLRYTKEDRKEVIRHLRETISQYAYSTDDLEAKLRRLQVDHKRITGEKNQLKIALAFLAKTIELVGDQDAAYVNRVALLVATNPTGIPSGCAAPSVDIERVLDLLRNNQKIAAIKYYREVTQTGLKEAKDRVDEIGRAHRC